MWINDNPKQSFTKRFFRIALFGIVVGWIFIILIGWRFYSSFQPADLKPQQNNACVMDVVRKDLKENTGSNITRRRLNEIVEYCDQLQEINNTRLEVIRIGPPIIVEIPEASK